MADRPYVRVYYEIVDDEKFANVYGDDRALATWLRLLLSADASYPASAPVPRWASQKTLKTLELSGLIQVRGHHYTVSGLAAERERRKQAALSGGLARGKQMQSGRSADADRPVSLSEPRRAKPSLADARAREGLPNLSDAVSDAWEEATGRSVLSSGEFALGYIDDACRRHPEAAVITAIREARSDFANIPTTQQLTVMVRGLLDPLPDAKAQAVAESTEDEQRRHEKAVLRTVLATHERGAHQGEPDPRCPECKTAGVA